MLSSKLGLELKFNPKTQTDPQDGLLLLRIVTILHARNNTEAIKNMASKTFGKYGKKRLVRMLPEVRFSLSMI
jgi:hypothetical protein